MKKFSKLAAILAVCAFIFGGLLVSCSPHGTGYGLDDGQSAGSGGAGGAGGGSGGAGGGSGNPGDGGGSGGAKRTHSGIYTESSAYYINVDSQSSPSDGNGAW
jgi:hypothetical protein